MWVWIGLDVLEERTDPTLDAIPVPAWVDPVAFGPAVVVPLAALLALLPRTHRVGLALGGAGLLVAAYAWSGPAGVGDWYVALGRGRRRLRRCRGCRSRVVGSRRRGRRPACRRALAGLVLAAAGAFLAWTCLQGGAYWQWRGQQRWRTGGGRAGALVVVGPDRAPGRRAEAGAPRAVVAPRRRWRRCSCSPAPSSSPRVAVVYRWEEIESRGASPRPACSPAPGSSPTVAPSGVGVTCSRCPWLPEWPCALLRLWHESTWGRLMR